MRKTTLFAAMFVALSLAPFASATFPLQIRAVVVQPQYVQPLQIQAVTGGYGCGVAQNFAVQQFGYAQPIQQFQAVQQFGYAQNFGVQRIGVQRIGVGFGGGSVQQSIVQRRGLFGTTTRIRTIQR